MSVRLACVKHAASVHPEPGSNSHVQSLWFRTSLAFTKLFFLPSLLLRFCSLNFFQTGFPYILFIRNLSGLHCCLFVKVLLPLSSNSFILSQVVCFVNNFFREFLNLFFNSFQTLLRLLSQAPLAFYQMLSHLSIPFLKNFNFLIPSFQHSREHFWYVIKCFDICQHPFSTFYFFQLVTIHAGRQGAATKLYRVQTRKPHHLLYSQRHSPVRVRS